VPTAFWSLKVASNRKPAWNQDSITTFYIKFAYWPETPVLVDQLNENLVPRGEIAKEWAARVGELTAGLTGLIDRLPPLLEGKDRAVMREIIHEEVWNLRDQYARDGRYSPELAS
jgi:hypothetical protein